MAHKATWKRQYHWSDRSQAAQIESKKWNRDYNTCADCGSTKLTLKNYEMMWGDGDLYCENGHLVRRYDSG